MYIHTKAKVSEKITHFTPHTQYTPNCLYICLTKVTYVRIPGLKLFCFFNFQRPIL